MTLKIARTKDTSRSPSDTKAPAQPGWDPFEVWRTRVLLPRLAEDLNAAPAEKNAPATVQLVRTKR